MFGRITQSRKAGEKSASLDIASTESAAGLKRSLETALPDADESEPSAKRFCSEKTVAVNDHQLFIEKLKQLFGLMHTKIKPQDMSELLRTIANFHREKTVVTPKTNIHIFVYTQILYEKAFAIEPRSVVMRSLAKLLVKAPNLDTIAFNIPETKATRRARFASECKQMGFVMFFWQSMEKHLQNLNREYGDNTSTVLMQLWRELEPFINKMIATHVPDDKIQEARNILTYANMELTKAMIQSVRSTLLSA